MKAFVLILVCVLLGACVHHSSSSFNDIPGGRLLKVPLTAEYWDVVYDGGGVVKFDEDGLGELVFYPRVARKSGQTFSSLLLLKNSLVKPVNDFVVRAEVTTVRQLRSSTPNDWEVFWFVSNYRKDPKLVKTANYFLQKPNSGVELGRFFQEKGQKFLMTSQAAPLEIGARSTFYFVKQGKRYRVFRDGDLVLDYLGKEMPESLYDQAGALGLYSEDAVVRLHSFEYKIL
ncbi:hypothetical protein [Bdellovibrio sp. HCB274]|uniref:hypothetical protein n=1 Tax=Bdellovibrio sp. HCB274 TaxID=3394361 RepID=UPI0039B3E02B